MKTDSELQQDVIDSLKWEPTLSATDIGVTAKAGVITLTGTVDCYSKKSEAEDAAKTVIGVKAVVEKIIVKHASNSVLRDDNDIATEIINAFKWNWEVPADKVKVTVEKGWVNLEGEVNWEFQRLAAKTATRTLQGVMGVSNNITLASQADNTVEVADIKRAFARNASIFNQDIGVQVSHHNAKLTGTVDSWYQKDEAGRLAWNAPGVWNVENELVVDYA